MAKYATGRTRTITVSGNLTGSVDGYVKTTYDPGDGVTVIDREERSSGVSGSINALGIALTFFAGYDIGAIEYLYNDSVSGPGASDDSSVTTVDPGPPGGSPPYITVVDLPTETPTGTWSVSIPVREYLEVTFLSGSGATAAFAYGIPDAPIYAKARVWEEVNPDGATPTWSISFGGSSASGTASLSGDISYVVSLSCTAAAVGDPASVSVTQDLGLTSETSTGSGAGGSYTANAGVSANAAGGLGTSHTVVANSATTPTKGYAVAGVLRAMEDAYPDSLTVTVSNPGTGAATLTGTGSFGGSGEQRYWSLSGSVDGVPGTPRDRNEWGAVGMGITPGSLSAQTEDEDPLCLRVTLRGKQWGAMSLEQAASVTLDDGTSLTPSGAWEGAWTATGDTVRSVVGGAVQCASAGGAGTLSRGFTDDVTFGSYRYLRVRVRSVGSASQSFTVKVGGKEWPAVTGADGTYVDADIDLCAPPNKSSATDTTDTKFPLDYAPSATPSPTGTRLSATAGDYWGVERTGEVEFSGLASGVTYEIDSLTLRRASYSRATFLQSLGWWTEEYPEESVSESGTTTTHETTRFLLGDTDGRQSLELAALRRQTTTGGMSGITTVTYTNRSILALIGLVNEATGVGTVLQPGWTATDLLPAPGEGCSPAPPALPPAQDCYYNSDREAGFLFGGGALCTGGTWTYGFDADVSSGATVQAQPMYDALEWWPGCGDVFAVGGGGATGAVTIAAAALLRAQAHGLAVDAGSVPASGVLVELRQSSDNSLRGDATSGADGAYQTDLPYGKGGLVHSATAVAGSNPSAGVTLYSRKRSRVVFRATEPGQGLTQDIAPSGYHARGEINTGGNIVVSYRADYQGMVWVDSDTGIAADELSIAIDPASDRHRVYLVYVETGTGIIKRAGSDDLLTWGGTMTINATGDHPDLCITPWGVQAHAWVQGTAIEGRTCDAQGNLSAVSTLVASGVDDKDIDIAYDPAADKFRLAYRSGGAIVMVSSSDHITYA